MTSVTPNWALPKLLCAPDDDVVGPDFSNLALLVLRELYDEFPKQIDLSKHKSVVEHRKEFGRLWEWLREHGVVIGPLSSCALTFSGKHSIMTALEYQPQFADELMQKKAALDERYAFNLLLTLLRHHFDEFHR